MSWAIADEEVFQTPEKDDPWAFWASQLKPRFEGGLAFQEAISQEIAQAEREQQRAFNRMLQDDGRQREQNQRLQYEEALRQRFAQQRRRDRERT